MTVKPILSQEAVTLPQKDIVNRICAASGFHKSQIYDSGWLDRRLKTLVSKLKHPHRL